MAKELDVVFEPSNKPEFIPTEEGKYPAHIVSLTTKEVNTRAGEAIIVNMCYQLADEAADETQLLWEMDGYKYKYSLSTNYLIRKVRMERHHLLHLEIILLHLPIKQFLLL